MQLVVESANKFQSGWCLSIFASTSLWKDTCSANLQLSWKCNFFFLQTNNGHLASLLVHPCNQIQQFPWKPIKLLHQFSNMLSLHKHRTSCFAQNSCKMLFFLSEDNSARLNVCRLQELLLTLTKTVHLYDSMQAEAFNNSLKNPFQAIELPIFR